MAESQGLHIEERQRMHLSQQQVRLARMLELNAPEMEDAVERELADNPALEACSEAATESQSAEDEFHETAEQLQRADYASGEDMPEAPFSTRHNWSDGDMPEFTPADSSESLYDNLNRQLAERSLNEDVARGAREIVGNLDGNGYLRRSLEGVADDLLFTSGHDLDAEVMEEALRAVQSLDPAGIGARDLRECLMLQVERQPSAQDRDDALNILQNGFEAFSMKHFHRLVSGLHLSSERVTAATGLILRLNPKPGASLGTGPGESARPVIPDYVVDVNDGRISVTLNNRIPELRISESFEKAVERLGANPKGKRSGGHEFFAQRYRDARDFISLLSRRQETLFAVATAIVEAQKEYFLSEDEQLLKPLGIRDVSERTGYDPSVISRATNNKYLATPWGIFPLRYFFHDSLGGIQGEVFTAKAAQESIKRLIENEDKRHPLSDEKLRDLLEAEGYDLSRRTVAKYRDRLKLPVARLRRSGV